MVRRWGVAIVALGLVVLLMARLWLPTPPSVSAPSPRAHSYTPPPVAQPGPEPVDTPAPRPPDFAPGQAVTIALVEPPAQRYLSAQTDGSDEFYSQLVREESRGKAVFDPSLGRAAREFVYQYSNLGMDPPSDVRTFLTASSGAIAGDTVFQHLRSNSDAEGALRQAIRAVLDGAAAGAGLLHVGVGEVYQPGASLARHIGAVATRLDIDVVPLASRVAVGEAWQLRGRMRTPWRHLEALELRPDGTLATLAVTVNGADLVVAVPGEAQPGEVELQVVGEGPGGPGKLVQVRVVVGQPLPTQYQTTLAPDETPLQSADKAAAYAMQLLNADRHRHHLPLLAWDPQLAAIAREHSADMRDNGFFGHVSPTTGMHPDRLAKAHYLASASAENVAHNPSIFEAELGLMHSLGHRRNILDPQMTHVGVGVAGAEDDQGRRRWWLTQLFARPTPHWTPAAAIAEVRQRLAMLRRDLDLPELAANAALDDVADTALQLALHEELANASNRALALAQERHAVHGRLRVWTALTGDLDQLDWPEAVKLTASRSLGVAAAQRDDGRVALILLISEGI